jgi:hypothetical protein
MASIIGPGPDIYRALETVNEKLASRSIAVSALKDEQRPEALIYLQITNSVTGETRNIGITHLFNLKAPDGDRPPFETIARTTDQVITAIIDRISLFHLAEKQGLYINETGTIFDFGISAVEVCEDGTFIVNGNRVRWGGYNILLSYFKSEGVITFRTLPNGDIHLSDYTDHTEGLFIDTIGEIRKR